MKAKYDKKTMPFLLMDFYKAVHSDMLPKKINKSVSYFTPRYNRVEKWDNVVMFILQGFIMKYLIDYFNIEFFDKDVDSMVNEFERVLNNSLGKDIYSSKKIRDLHKLGYLPIEIKALPEGIRVPMKVPMFEISNTHPDFAWLPQALESLISTEVWHPMVSATVGYEYRQIVNKYFDISVDDSVDRSRALSEFAYRGQECNDSATKSSAAWLLSFLNSATVPAIPYLENFYNCDCTKEPVAFGGVSTEHSVHCSNFAVDGDEITLFRRLLTELYPNNSFSVVCDSYDYWNVVENILPQLKPEILAHNGCMMIRGDSGDPVETVTNTVFKLWDIFGGTYNSKGFKVLDPHIKAIYGDSITLQRCEEIYEILIKKGFACSNVSLGVGSFSMQCIEETKTEKCLNCGRIEETKVLSPFTRDTFSSCIKATYCEVDNEPHPIFKDPKEGGFKKSQKGMCYVYYNSKGELDYKDGYTSENIPPRNLLETVFKDGVMVKEHTLAEIRNRLHEGEF